MTPLVLRVTRPDIPFVPRYCVVSVVGRPGDPRAIRALCETAHRVARREARRVLGDPEAYTLLFNAGRTRRRQDPHVHVVLAASVADKRRALFWLALKHVTRAVRRRWRSIVAVGTGSGGSPGAPNPRLADSPVGWDAADA